MNPRSAKFHEPGALLAAAILLLGGGCATPEKAATDGTAKKPADEYVYYTPTGSNIPVRVRKADLKATDSESARDQMALRRAVQQGTKQPSGN